LLVRIPMSGESLGEIVWRHDAIASSMGCVWFGSCGQAPMESRLASLTQQIERSIPTSLYLVQRRDETLQVFQSQILGIARSVPSTESHLVPPYYASPKRDFKAVIWLKLQEFKEMPHTAIRLLRVEKTGSPVTFVLMRSMASILIVIEGESEAAPPVRRSPLPSWKATGDVV